MITRLVTSFAIGLTVGLMLLSGGCSLHDPQKTLAEDAESAAEPRRSRFAWMSAGRSQQNGTQPMTTAGATEDDRIQGDPDDLWTHARAQFQFSSNLNHPRIQPYLSHYQRHHNIITVSVTRAEPFAYFILSEIERRGLPGELLLLPIVESGYAPEATSPSRAAGIWQFIPSTGNHFGLTQDDWYDGRRDVYQSTHAALDYLESLHARFDDWYLALAAYNFGQGNIARAIATNAARGRPTDYWSLQLSDEAMAYVPRMLALRKIFANPAAHGVSVPVIAYQPHIDTIQLQRQADLLYLAELAQLDRQELLRLNPGYRRNVTHPRTAQHVVLPASAAQRLQHILQERGADYPLLRHTQYTVRTGDTLGRIAHQHGVTIDMLKQANRLSSDRIHIGQTLLIQRSPASLVAQNPQPAPARSNGTPATPAPDPAVITTVSLPAVQPTPPTTTQDTDSAHTVAMGESLWAISQSYQISLADLRSANNLTPDAILQPGQSLRIPNAAIDHGLRRHEYRIQAGDSLNSIARRFQVSIADLQRWNGLSDDQIRAGDTLVVYLARQHAQDPGRDRHAQET